MDFLELARRTARKCKINRSSLTAVTSLPENLACIVDHVDEAWMDIQMAHTDWGWMRAPASFVTVAGQAVYPLGTTAGTVGVSEAAFGEWARNTGRRYLTAVGTNSEIPVGYVPYEYWRNAYQLGAPRNVPIPPTCLSISPTKAICLPPALAGYTVTLDYFQAPTHLVSATDEPSLPSQFHMAIVYRAMMFYGSGEVSPEAYNEGEAEFTKMMARLDSARLPEVVFSGALS